MPRPLLIVLFHLCALDVSAQVNLVPNGSFEEYIDCPGVGTVWSSLMGSNCPGWVTPSQGSPDYYHTCAENSNNTVLNVFGPQPPHSGEAYIGTFTFHMGQPELREYAQTELSEPIAAGVRYLVSFYVSLSDTSTYAVSTLGAHFGTTAIGSNDVWVLPVEPDVVNDPVDSLIDPTIWYHITDTFVSRNGGGERYLTIGNFSVAAESDTFQVRQGWEGTVHMSYYYIDDVSVVALDTLNSVAEAAQGRMALWPNPAGEKVKMTVQGSKFKVAEVVVIDHLGRSVLNLRTESMNNVTLSGVEGFELSVTHLPSGIYTVSVHLSDGTILHQRLVVQHR